MKLGVNLFDLDRIVPAVKANLINGNLDLDAGAVQVVKESPSEVCVGFSCDALTAACIIDTLRAHDRNVGDSPTRAYVLRKAWSRIPGNVPCAVVEDGQCKLNPALFRAEPTPGVPPQVRPVKLG